MLQLADKYKDKLQIAFKPHPSLLRELYNHPEWGPKRTDDYYNQWNSKPNTQLETGDYVALFSGSDAMVHDSGSFIVDYQYFRKPVMYVSQNIALSKKYGNDFSKMAYDQHYIGKTYDDIERFIVEVVLEGNDTMKSSRDEFYCKFMLPPNGRSVADNTYDDIVKSIGL
jgi:CDP-glycerol glycerophosphotransferase (TagB/SpsB family)